MWQEPYLWWMAFGFLLLIVEMITGTFFFLAVAAAAFMTTGVAWLSNDYATQWIAFSISSILALVVWQKLRPTTKHHKTDAASGLNNRTRHLVGRQAILTEPISNGIGRINVDDSWWKVVCVDDMPIGTHIKVTAVHDMILTVEKV
ncbi:MAG: NfeD family protein [Moraxellaceae bacterium]|nr:NfeD family protein [Moraxellaceae bacterium]